MSSPIRYLDRKDTRLIVLHDSHTIPEVTAVEDVPRWAVLAHRGGLEMGLLSIGYHYIIERDGEVVQCRGREKIGSHTPGHNMDSIGVCLVGGREPDLHEGIDNFTPAQRLSLLRLLHELRTAYPKARVKSHSEVQKFRDRSHPPCPPIDMDLLREDLDLYAKGIVL